MEIFVFIMWTGCFSRRFIYFVQFNSSSCSVRSLRIRKDKGRAVRWTALRLSKKSCQDFSQPKNAVTFPLLRSGKVPASWAARLAKQGFAGHLIGFEAGFDPSSSPHAVQLFTSGREFFDTLQGRPSDGPACKPGALLQIEKRLHAGVLGNAAQFPIVCHRTQWAPK